VTLFDNNFSALHVAPSQFEDYKPLERASTAGLDFNPFRFTILPWVVSDMQRPEHQGFSCDVTTCGQPATEGWTFTEKVRGRVRRSDWRLCEQHWFFPANWESFLLPEEERPEWVTFPWREYVVAEATRLKSLAEAREKEEQKALQLTVYDQFLLDDF
jgi:hypothetical protein